MSDRGVRVCVGAEVHELLAREDFVARWHQLYERCPWATAGQHPEFARTWYRVYRERAVPVLAFEEHDGELVGLVGLYRHHGGGLEHVGRGYCEYNVWTALPEHGESFMARAIAALDLKLERTQLEFGFMPPGTPIGWLAGATRVAQRCQLGHTSRRIVRVSDPELVRSYVQGKSRLRTSMNRLKRTGDVRFRRVLEVGEIKRVLLEFESLFEFRKAAVFGALPFRDEPLRRECLLAQAEVPGLLHVTTLERSGKILAAHVATCGRRELSIAGIAHSEFEANHSPGMLLILELIPLLCREGLECLDFTPGDDEYKSRFGTESQPVYTLTVNATRLARAAERARELSVSAVKSVAQSLPEPAQQRLKALRSRLLASSPVVSRSGSALIPKQIEFHELSTEPGAVSLQPVTAQPLNQQPLTTQPWARNSTEDLIRYSGERSSYVELLRRAFEYVRAGARMYTRTSRGRLEATCFVIPSSAFEPAIGLSSGVVLCELERWGDAASRERWLQELALLLSSEQPLFLARPASLHGSTSRKAVLVGQAAAPLQLMLPRSSKLAAARPD